MIFPIPNQPPRGHETPYATDRWETFSDLMAGLLLLFVLSLSAIMVLSAQERVRHEIEKNRLEALENEAVKRLGIRTQIIESLQVKLKDYEVDVDAMTGAIVFGDKVFFAEGEAEVSESGKKMLNNILNAYEVVFFDQNFEQYLSRIIVEGHTNDNGSYLYNLRLSQERAFAVMNYLLLASEGRQESDKFKNFLVASGRSYADLKYLSDGSVDKIGSRRIEMKFTLKDEEAIKELQHMLNSKMINKY